MVGIALGAVVVSLVVFALLVCGVATWPAFAILGLTAVWCGRRFRLPSGLEGRPPILHSLILAVYAVFYLICTLAPEIQPDGFTYHLGLAAEYARLGAFPSRVAFFEMLPQGMEMLYLPAFLTGGQSAAKLVNFGFLAATVPLIVSIARRLELPEPAPWTAAALYFCTPVVGLTGTSSYTDAAVVFFAMAAFDRLLEWKQDCRTILLVHAGLLAGFCAAIKISAVIVPFAGVVFVLAQRRFRSALWLAAIAVIPLAPWIARAWILTGNPAAPLLNWWFRNAYFHPQMDRVLAESWRTLEGVPVWRAPWELAVGGKLHGLLGPVYLLLPLSLLALRRPAGRLCLAAAVLLSLPWFTNHGARFLMPALPFFALLIAAAVPPRAAWSLAAMHAILSLPPVIPLYANPHTWRLEEFPWRAALRLESEDAYLKRRLGEYEIARMLEINVPSDGRTLSLLDTPRAYIRSEALDYWQSAEAERLVDTLQVASQYANDPLFDVRAEWPEQPLTGVRLRLEGSLPGEFCVHEISFLLGEDRVHASPQWVLGAWPNRWEAPLAFDANLATRWRTWEPAPRGMFVQAVFDRSQRLSAAGFRTHVTARPLPVELFGRDVAGKWNLMAGSLRVAGHEKLNLRPAAVRHLKRRGIGFILAATEEYGAWQLGRHLIGHEAEWGLEHLDQRGFVHLLKVP
ncbi:MAG: hypothetical protein ACRD8O_14150 [Bryobacteraceae bacterium]